MILWYSVIPERGILAHCKPGCQSNDSASAALTLDKPYCPSHVQMSLCVAPLCVPLRYAHRKCRHDNIYYIILYLIPVCYTIQYTGNKSNILCFSKEDKMGAHLWAAGRRGFWGQPHQVHRLSGGAEDLRLIFFTPPSHLGDDRIFINWGASYEIFKIQKNGCFYRRQFVR